MAYKNDSPKATDKINVSQLDIKNNFAEIKTLVDVNHETFGDAEQGKHVKVDLTDQTASPPTSAAGEVTLYSNAGELCLSKDGGAEIDITTATLAATGRCKLPCGLEMKWGTGSITSGASTATITFAAAFTNNCYSIQITPTSFTGDARDYVISAKSLTKTGCTPTRSTGYTGTTANFNWVAIGD